MLIPGGNSGVNSYSQILFIRILQGTVNKLMFIDTQFAAIKTPENSAFNAVDIPGGGVTPANNPFSERSAAVGVLL